MDRHEQRIKTAEAALKTLIDILDSPGLNDIQRDAAIQRFEYSFEAVWKAARAYLFDVEGIDAASPKRVLRESRNVGLLSDEQTALGLQMVDDRNLTSHTYHEGLAQKIYEKLEIYAGLMQSWLHSMKQQS